ncbi:Chondroadherin-like protein [Penaeus vannamei]|uniref:Chondroadherin-like protein n=1 Tax=Penaeus vannamei TaxID=6689 RepID=A0A3R7QBN5_PENVA|nr:Chondroadherin-like protein [Penaeus vannamei]
MADPMLGLGGRGRGERGGMKEWKERAYPRPTASGPRGYDVADSRWVKGCNALSDAALAKMTTKLLQALTVLLALLCTAVCTDPVSSSSSTSSSSTSASLTSASLTSSSTSASTSASLTSSSTSASLISSSTSTSSPTTASSGDKAAGRPLTGCHFHRLDQMASCRGLNASQLAEALTEYGERAKEAEVSLEGNGTRQETDAAPSPHLRELSLFYCRIPKLTGEALGPPDGGSLEIISIVSSGVEEVLPDALAAHARTLTRLVLAHNLLAGVPEAVANLTRLEVLDLRHNRINHLPEGTLLFNLHRLRQLHLDHNLLGQIADTQTRLGISSSGLSLTVFNLEPLRTSLRHLTLAHNALSAFPEQFSRPFDRLTNLDLSSNKISKVLRGAFVSMPRLQFLDLSSNLLHAFDPKNLSSSLLDLNLAGNPWSCECDSLWLLKKLDGSSSPAVTAPTCASPLHLRHRPVTSLKEADVCPAEDTDNHSRVVYVGDDVDGALADALDALHLLNVTALNHQALLVSWRVEAQFYASARRDPDSAPLSWAITLRQADEDPRLAGPTKMRLERYKAERADWVPGESLFTEVVAFVTAEDYVAETERVVIAREARRVSMSWNVTIQPKDLQGKREAMVLRPLGWKILYRRFGDENETEVVLVSRGGEPVQNFTNHYTVEGLDPGTAYVFCFNSLTDLQVAESLKTDGDTAVKDMTSEVLPHQHVPRDPDIVRTAARGRSVQSGAESQVVGGRNPAGARKPPPLPPSPPRANQDSPRQPAPSPSQPRACTTFVYTSTGQRIAVPLSSGSPFNLPSVVNPNFNPRNVPPPPIPSLPPTTPRQRFIYEFNEEERPSEQSFTYDFTTESTSTTEKPEGQRFTYVTRRRRSVAEEESNTSYMKLLESGVTQYCEEVVTLRDDDVITPVAIATTVSTSTTVVKPSWKERAAASTRKISTISSPTPVSVYSRSNSVANGVVTGEGRSGGLKSAPAPISPRKGLEGINGFQGKTARSVSVTSSSGYLTPLPGQGNNPQDPETMFSEAKSYLPSQKAYLNSVKDRLLQQHKDLQDFHPGYDIPPTSSSKAFLGYDYPHPTPVNPIGSQSDGRTKSEVVRSLPTPSPSSSDSNYNASIGSGVVPPRPQVNLNIPLKQAKSSDINKSLDFNSSAETSQSLDYNYIAPEDVTSRPRTFVRHVPGKSNHRRFGHPQPVHEDQTSRPRTPYDSMNACTIQHSRSVPDLVNAESESAHLPAATRLNLLIGSQTQSNPSATPREGTEGPAVQPSSLPPSYDPSMMTEVNGYVNVSAGEDKNKDRDVYHTWGSSSQGKSRSRPSLGDIVLTGGTLIEVPEGYVIPKPPKPTRTVRLLVPGEEKAGRTEPPAKETSLGEEQTGKPLPPPPLPTKGSLQEEKKGRKIVLPPLSLSAESDTSSKEEESVSQITHLVTPELQPERVVVSTGLAV